MLKNNIQNLHHKIYRYTKNLSQSFEGEPSAELVEYKRNHQKLGKRDFDLSDYPELFKQISNSQIVYLGDFHTFDQSTRNLERIIKAMEKKGHHYMLGLEMVHQRFQPQVDAFLESEITEQEFLEGINYGESWRFPWNHYQTLFSLAKKNNIPILALNTSGTLTQRDESAAKSISDFIATDSTLRLLILFGELHLGPKKLPHMVGEKLGHPPITIIHQNLDQPYWSLQEMGATNTKVIRFGQDEFSLQTSPPWIKYESMIYWYENLCDDPDFDIHDYIIETGQKIFGSNTNDNFQLICSEIVTSLGLSKLNFLDDFNLYDHSRIDFVSDKVNKISKKSLISFFEYLITTNQIFKITKTRDYYCPNYSMNRFSYMAGIHIFACSCKQRDIDPYRSLSENSNEQKFISLISWSFSGYLASKVINPYRKCDLYQDIISKAEIEGPFKKTNEIAVSILDQNKPLQEILKGKNLILIHQVANIVGHFLAEMLYEKIKKNPNLKSNEALNFPFYCDEVNLNSYQRLIEFLLPNKQFKMQRKSYF